MMNITTRTIPHIFRNKYLRDTSTSVVAGSVDSTGNHTHNEYLTEHQANGGYIFAEAFSKTSFYTALSSALASVKDGESAIIDCTYFKG